MKMDADMEAMTAEAETLLIPAEHPHAEFLRSCVRDALSRLLIPSLERELRREMAEAGRRARRGSVRTQPAQAAAAAAGAQSSRAGRSIPGFAVAASSSRSTNSATCWATRSSM